jgi:hypothetical protein
MARYPISLVVRKITAWRMAADMVFHVETILAVDDDIYLFAYNT